MLFVECLLGGMDHRGGPVGTRDEHMASGRALKEQYGGGGRPGILFLCFLFGVVVNHAVVQSVADWLKHF